MAALHQAEGPSGTKPCLLSNPGKHSKVRQAWPHLVSFLQLRVQVALTEAPDVQAGAPGAAGLAAERLACVCGAVACGATHSGPALLLASASSRQEAALRDCSE